MNGAVLGFPLVGTRFLFVVGLSWLSTLAACGEPAAKMRGWVHRTDDEPVAGATVHSFCEPDSTWGEITATTRSDGTFAAEGLGSFNDECRIEVKVKGEPTRGFKAVEYCDERGADDCQTLVAHLVIPEPGAE